MEHLEPQQSFCLYTPVTCHCSLVESHSVLRQTHIDRHTTKSGYNGFEWVYNIFMPLNDLKTVFDHKIC